MRVSRALAALVAFALAGAPIAAPAEQPVFTIPVVLSLTGTAAFVGNEETNSLHLIEEAVNAEGGIRGHRLAFAIQDDQSSPQVGVQLVNGLIASHVPVILGPTFTAVCAAVAPIVRDNGPVTYCYSPGIHPTPGSYIFSATMSSRDAGVAMARYFRGRGWQRIGLITSTDTSGEDFDRGFLATLALPENASLQVVAHERFATSDLNVNAQLARIKAANPQVLVTWTTGTGFGTVLHGIADVGLNVPVTGGNGNMIPKQLAGYRTFIPAELYFPGMRGLSSDSTAAGPVRQKQQVYFTGMAAHHNDISFSSQSGWDATWIVIDAYRALGLTPTATQVRDWIRNQHGWVGMEGVYDFGDPEQRGLNSMATVIDRFYPATGKFTAVSKPGGAPR
jgi:branched-chain amino acid transport system substrate-binding protein